MLQTAQVVVVAIASPLARAAVVGGISGIHLHGGRIAWALRGGLGSHPGEKATHPPTGIGIPASQPHAQAFHRLLDEIARCPFLLVTTWPSPRRADPASVLPRAFQVTMGACSVGLVTAVVILTDALSGKPSLASLLQVHVAGLVERPTMAENVFFLLQALIGAIRWALVGNRRPMVHTLALPIGRRNAIGGLLGHLWCHIISSSPLRPSIKRAPSPCDAVVCSSYAYPVPSRGAVPAAFVD